MDNNQVEEAKEPIGSYVRPICLPKPDGGIKPFSTNKIWVTGYGLVESSKKCKRLKIENSFKEKESCLAVIQSKSAKVLKEGQMHLITNKKCTSKLGASWAASKFRQYQITDTQVCSHSKRKNAVDTCPGDSGGPMSMAVTPNMIMKHNKRKTLSTKTKMYNQIERYQLEGITSWGFGCGQKLPGVFTKVSRFMDFILKHSKYVQTVENEVLSS